jgi:transposase-like protein
MRDVNVRYSLAFKQQVISDIESGRMRPALAEKVYDVSQQSIYNWMKEFGKEHLCRRTIRVETPTERQHLKELEEKNRQLESALAQTQVKVIALEALIEVAQEHYQADFKKNFGPKLSTGSAAADSPSA